MLKKIALAIPCVTLLACAGADSESSVAQSNDELGACELTAPIGSPEWRAQLEACRSGGSGSGQSCSTSVSCKNGSCTCSGGANAGKSCDGTSTTGADSCSVLCKACSGGSSSGGSSSGATPAPSPGGGSSSGAAPAPGGGSSSGAAPGGGGQANCNEVSCTNGGCECAGGPNKGKACDGAQISGPSSCNVLCRYTADKCEGKPPSIPGFPGFPF